MDAPNSYPCDICGKPLKISNITYHKMIHSGKRPYSCDICEKTFTNKCGMVNHKRIHTGEKPYIMWYMYKNFKSE
jgi:KRAB domain-containing zinc finger protein